MTTFIQSFIKHESSGGILLIFAMLLAMLMANTVLDQYYHAVLQLPVEVRVGSLQLAKPLLLWINDGLMAVFFFLVGLEVKREVLTGQLSKPEQIVLPGVAAIGGMAVPALVYVFFNMGDETAMRGWAIPTATDIAFALGVLSLLGSRVPVSLKLFLMTLAIIDDLGAIIIIALFYTVDLSVESLMVASAAVVALILMNRLGVMRIAAYVLVGTVLWVSVLKSGVHATLAGVVLAFAIPMSDKKNPGYSPLETLEHALHPWVAFMILPLFAFANAGVALAGMSLEKLAEPVPMGIMLGLFLGKQLGVFLFSAVAIGVGWCKKPEGSTWLSLYAVAVLTGIGFTMSLFIDSLAFEGMEALFNSADKLAVLIGSFASAILGYLLLLFGTKAADNRKKA
ncbi:Na+/H+ antiporter NhaA [Neptuniibacter halophilus]|uniref:Na+/H+ antiporter NhaA n=1 Tax=Neptuniibacter halophilus TaxID=651666 RepID=UPI0025724360|nr:Na+/H+ antiporter NhaA [Neptuniibacter halophilus]